MNPEESSFYCGGGLVYHVTLPVSGPDRRPEPPVQRSVTWDFVRWLREAHDETCGSAREAYNQVAERLAIPLTEP